MMKPSRPRPKPNKDGYQVFLDACEATLTVVLAVSLVLTLTYTVKAWAQSKIDPEVTTEVATYGSASVIVTFVSQAAADGAPAEHRYTTSPAILTTVDAAYLQNLDADPNVLRVDLNAPFTFDTAAGQQLINADLVHAQGHTGAGQLVIILDSGVNPNHPELAGRITWEACYSSDTPPIISPIFVPTCPNGTVEQTGPGAGAPCTYPGCDHGTAVARSGVGSEGVAPGADIGSVQLTTWHTRLGRLVINRGDIVRALEGVLAAVQGGLNVAAVNLSLSYGSPWETVEDCELRDTAMVNAVSALVQEGITVVSSSGNTASESGVKAPACFADVISVGGLNLDGTLYTSGSHGPLLDVFAAMDYGTGTSFSSPQVAGAIAVIRGFTPHSVPFNELNALVSAGSPVNLSYGTKPKIQLDQAIAALDADSDGYGNLCDGDFNQDQFVGGPDFTTLMGCYGQPVSLGCEVTDMDSDGFVGIGDYNLFLAVFDGPPCPVPPAPPAGLRLN